MDASTLYVLLSHGALLVVVALALAPHTPLDRDERWRSVGDPRIVVGGVRRYERSPHGRR